MQRRSGEDLAVRQFEGRKGAGPAEGPSRFRGRGGARGHVGRGGRSLQGSGRIEVREGQGRRGAAMGLSSACGGRSAQWEEEMVREQQQKPDGEDVVMQEMGDGEV